MRANYILWCWVTALKEPYWPKERGYRGLRKVVAWKTPGGDPGNNSARTRGARIIFPGINSSQSR